MTNQLPRNPRNDAILIAREVLSRDPIFLDTETTGLTRNDEIVEISLIDNQGNLIYESLVRPSQSISPDAYAVHGISNDSVKNAPAWPVIWPTLRTHLVGRLICAYNAEFDMRMMQQSHTRYRLPWKENFKSFDIMQLYSQFKGEWDNVRRQYRYHSLDKAGKECQILIPNAHRAATDALLARALLHYISNAAPVA
ncbi:MAG: 3'-5' exonuclease [Anaerolineae bacterium]|nr:3'-5' exonuclease [Anaerolineae bacterium]